MINEFGPFLVALLHRYFLLDISAKSSLSYYAAMSVTNPLKYRFLTERYAKENRDIKLEKEFIFTRPTGAVTRKFYAKHEAFTDTDGNEEYLKDIERHVFLKPKDIYTFRPPSVNMEYGWFIEPLLPRSQDSRLYFPKKHCDFIRNELQLRKLQKNLVTEKFTGTPFKL